MTNARQITVEQALLEAEKATRAAKYSDAITLYEAILKYQPDNIVAKTALDALYHGTNEIEVELDIKDILKLYRAGYLDQVQRHCEYLIKTGKESVQVFNLLGAALHGQSRLEASENAYVQAISMDPNYADSYNNLANLLSDMGRHEEALSKLGSSLELRPDFPEVYNNRANAYRKLGMVTAAIADYQKAIKLKPDYIDAYSNLGGILGDSGEHESAIENYEKALSLKPDFFACFSNLLFTLTQIETSRGYLERAQAFGGVAEEKVKEEFSGFSKQRISGKIRLGLVSGDFRRHPVGYFLESFLSEIDRTKIEITAYSASRIEDELTQRIKKHFDAWKRIDGLNDIEAAKMIHDDGIGILFDLSGHTQFNRLPVFAWRPAPVQVTWLGYFATTGIKQIDYILGDPLVTPDGEENHFTEEPWRLPESYFCFSMPDIDIDIEGLPAADNKFITYGCFNSLIKMNDAVVSVWAEILNRSGNARLFLKTKLLGDKVQREKVRRRFLEAGITEDRLILEGGSPRLELLECYNRVDISLDPFPYPGGTTSVESLWMGVPVLTRKGNHFLSHVGETIVTNAGLSDWIAGDDIDYINRALSFGSDLESLSALRRGLRSRLDDSALYNGRLFARHFEDAIEGMWVRWEGSGR